MARLDRITAAKEVAQAAACIGREFSSVLLASIVDIDGLEEKLNQLVNAGLIFVEARETERDIFSSTHWSRTPPGKACW